MCILTILNSLRIYVFIGDMLTSVRCLSSSGRRIDESHTTKGSQTDLVSLSGVPLLTSEPLEKSPARAPTTTMDTALEPGKHAQ